MGYNWFDSYFDEFSAPLRVRGDGLLNVASVRGAPRENEDTTLQADLAMVFRPGNSEHNFLFGAEKIENREIRSDYTVDFDRATPVPDGMGGTLTGRDIYFEHNPFLQPPLDLNSIFTTASVSQNNSAEVLGYYATYQATLVDERLHTMLGVRRVEFESSLDEVAETVYSAGLTYEIVDGFTFFGSFSQNFIPTINISASGPGARPEEIFQLPTESAEGWDIGLKTNWQEGKLSGTVTLFELERLNIARNAVEKREEDPRNNDNDPNNDVSFRSAGGLERSQGVEVDLIWSPNRNYQALMAYSYLWEADQVSDPNYLPGTLYHSIQIGRRLRTAPEHTFAFFNRYTITEGSLQGFTVGAGCRYTGEHGPLNHNAQFNVVNDSSLVFDAFIKYSTTGLIGEETSFQLNIENLTDEFYIIGNRSAGDPFKAYFTARVSF